MISERYERSYLLVLLYFTEQRRETFHYKVKGLCYQGESSRFEHSSFLGLLGNWKSMGAIWKSQAEREDDEERELHDEHKRMEKRR